MWKKVGDLAYAVAALAWMTGPGCGSDPPPCALIGSQFVLAESPLTLSKNAVLLRAGDGFVLAGSDGASIRWAQLSSSGEVASPSGFTLSETPATTTGGQSLGPVFAVTSKTAPGDQLVTAVAVLRAGTTDRYEVHAYVQDLGSSTTPKMLTLGELAAAPTSGTIRLAAGNPPNGTGRALVLWGVEGQAAPITYQMIGADGALVGEPQKLLDDPDPSKISLWSCANTTQNGSGFAITLVEAPSVSNGHPIRSAWRRFVINDDGSLGESAQFELLTAVGDCRIVSMPSTNGHLVAWQNKSNDIGGTYFARMTPPPPSAGPDAYDDVTTKKVMAAELYGGYASMPRLAWIAPSDYEVTIGLSRSQGPEVVRFNSAADPRGGPLYLPSVSGHTTPVSAWVDLDAVYVTYLDMPSLPNSADTLVPAGSRRIFVKVQPAALR
jgi:hypothetical protein